MTLLPPPPPEAPYELTSISEDDNTFKLTWFDNSEYEQGFEIEIREESGEYLLFALINNNTASYSFPINEYGKTYYFRIRAYNDSGYSDYSNETQIQHDYLLVPVYDSDNYPEYSSLTGGTDVTVEITNQYGYMRLGPGINISNCYFHGFFYGSSSSQEGPLIAPYNLDFSLDTGNSVLLSWDDCSDNELGFKIERRTTDGEFVQIGMTGRNVTEYRDLNASFYDAYYRVYAYNLTDQSDYSNEVYVINNYLKVPFYDSNDYAEYNILTGGMSLTVEATDTDEGYIRLRSGVRIGGGAYFHGFFTEPEISSDIPVVTGESQTENTQPTWSWTCGPETIAYRYQLDSTIGTWTGVFPYVTSYTPDTPLSYGLHTLYVQASASPNNWSESGSFTINISPALPDIPLVTCNSDPEDTTPAWTWIGSADTAHYRYQLDSEAGAWTEVDSGITEYIPASPLSEGAHTLYVQASNYPGYWTDSGSYTFTIVLITTINITYPPDSEVLDSNIEHEISWECGNINVNIEVFKDDELVETIVSDYDSDANNDTYTWTIPDTYKDMYYSDQYIIRISNSNNPDVFDVSSNITIRPVADFTEIISEIILPDSNSNHWIPNNGDILSGITVSVSCIEDGNPSVLQNAYSNIKISAPIDPYWDTDDTGNNNIHRNKGTCSYGFYAMYGNGDNYLLAEFYRNGSETDNNFQISYNNEFIDNNGKADEASGYFLRTSVAGSLYFRDESRDTGNTDTATFGIRVMDNSGIARPGDDMQLSFSLADYPLFADTVSEGGFMAVYDKPLLWRANLYIKEADNDWNYLNPWNEPLDVNEWNFDYDDLDNDGDPFERGNGVQIITPVDFIWHRNDNDSATNTNTSADIDDNTGYNLGGSDSPFEFNEKMNIQMDILNYYITNNIDEYGQYGNGWTSTLAPGGVWENYVRNWNSVTQGYEPVDANGVQFPYLPDLTNYRNRYKDDGTDYTQDELNNGDNWDTSWSGESAGVDCVGFLQRSASYINRPDYKMPAIGPHLYNSGGISGRRYIITQDTLNNYQDYNWLSQFHFDNNMFYLWEISERVIVGEPVNLDKVVPGDIFYYTSADGYHVAIVQSVNITGNERNPGLTDIVLIEATWGGGSTWAKVTNENTVSGYDDRDWVLGRLIIE